MGMAKNRTWGDWELFVSIVQRAYAGNSMHIRAFEDKLMVHMPLKDDTPDHMALEERDTLSFFVRRIASTGLMEPLVPAGHSVYFEDGELGASSPFQSPSSTLSPPDLIGKITNHNHPRHMSQFQVQNMDDLLQERK